MRDFGLADWALGKLIGGERRALDVKPLVDARPAIEVPTEGDYRVICKVQADIAIETTIMVF